ncbi:MAG TPA: universal stress protein [Pseudolabrys sp.]|nr:universal stress protein [Pseudolabrys sp.]
MIKDIVVNLGLGAHDVAGDFAISIAKEFDSHVLGIALACEPAIPGTVMGNIPASILEAPRAEVRKSAENAVRRFTQAATRAGVAAETHTITDVVTDAATQFGAIARRFDLVVVGQAERDESLAAELANEAALFDSGRPVIFVPFIQKGGLKLDRVLACWDGSRAATRAIADSMPFLRGAKAVEIVMVTGGKPETDEIAGADLGQHLARHGLKVDVKRLVSGDIDVVSTILSYAADVGADLIVMGGYGHSRLREFILGGVTRGILSSMTVPVLMSH